MLREGILYQCYRLAGSFGLQRALLQFSQIIPAMAGHETVSLHKAWCTCVGGWRNGLLFDPLMKYGNYSYADVMLYPLAAALAAASDPDTKIYLAMQVCIPPCA